MQARCQDGINENGVRGKKQVNKGKMDPRRLAGGLDKDGVGKMKARRITNFF